MYTQQPQFHQFPSQFYPNQNYGFAQPQFPQVVYSNRKLEHINCVIPPSEQAGGLFIGDTISTLKQQILVTNNIRAILCCNAQAAKNIYSIHIPIDFQYINIQDHVQYPIKIHFDNAISFIQSKIKNKMNVLVQCHGGASRSATIICAYLIKAKSWNYEQALQFLKEKRPRVKPNYGFLVQLEQYSRIMNKENLKQEQTKIQKEVTKQIQKSLQKEEFQTKQVDIIFQTPKKQNKDEDNISQGKNQIRQAQSNKVDRKISEIKSLEHTPDKNRNKIDNNIFKFHTQKKRMEIFSPKKSFNPPSQKPKQNLRHSITGTDLPYTFFANENNKYVQKIQQPFSSPQPQHKVPIMNNTNPIFYSPQNTYQSAYQNAYQNTYIQPQPFQSPQTYNQMNYIDQQFQSNGYKTFNGGYGTNYMNTYPVGNRGRY